jgi:nucleoporin POM34
VNIVNAFLPLIRRYYPDDIADIPLTPSQRTSMGLKPSASAQTPGSSYASPAYVTPPRYSRSTPRSSFSNQSERPLMGSGSPVASLGRSTSSTSYSPALGSSANKRASYGGGSPFNNSLFGDSGSSAGPGTPTPSTGKASVGLNNKWLYEKRRDSPRSGMFA